MMKVAQATTVLQEEKNYHTITELINLMKAYDTRQVRFEERQKKHVKIFKRHVQKDEKTFNTLIKELGKIKTTIVALGAVLATLAAIPQIMQIIGIFNQHHGQ